MSGTEIEQERVGMLGLDWSRADEGNNTCWADRAQRQSGGMFSCGTLFCLLSWSFRELCCPSLAENYKRICSQNAFKIDLKLNAKITSGDPRHTSATDCMHTKTWNLVEQTKNQEVGGHSLGKLNLNVMFKLKWTQHSVCAYNHIRIRVSCGINTWGECKQDWWWEFFSVLRNKRLTEIYMNLLHTLSLLHTAFICIVTLSIYDPNTVLTAAVIC